MNLISASTIQSPSFQVGIPFLASEILSKKKDAFFLNPAYFTEYLACDRAAFTHGSTACSDFVTNHSSFENHSNLNSATHISNPRLSPQISDCLMGKSPLRLVAQRSQANAGEGNYWLETLECGHSYISFPSTLSDAEPTAKRRRCQECKGEQPLRYVPYVPLSLKKNCLTLRVFEYLDWAQGDEQNIHLKDDIAIARLAVLLAGQGDPEPWRWAFIKLLGGSPEKLIPIFVARMEAHRNTELPPKKPSTSETLKSYPARRKYSQLGFNHKSEESA